MNIFVLNTGRCGSTTFIRACSHIINYSSAHESRWEKLGNARMAYPSMHIEADNRLSWLLGRLDRAYGKEAFYVHLTRNEADTAESFVNRFSRGIISAYRSQIVGRDSWKCDPKELSLDYIDTVNSNISLFLKDKPHWLPFRLETAKPDFREFWKKIRAEGDLDAALKEFDVSYNATSARSDVRA